MLNAAVFPLYKVPLDLVSMTQSHVLFNFPLQANQSDDDAFLETANMVTFAPTCTLVSLKGKIEKHMRLSHGYKI